MKLVNCPVCGARCSSDTEHCPECGYEIRDYFEERSADASASVASGKTANKSADRHTMPGVQAKLNPMVRIVTIVTVVVLAVVGILSFWIGVFMSKPVDHQANTVASSASTAKSAAIMITAAQTTSAESAISESTATKPATSTPAVPEPVPDSQSLTPSTVSSSDIAGVFRGDDAEILVLNTDGLAYYYCASPEFTELQCPWALQGDQVTIEFSRLHCTLYADADPETLIFRSDSANWNTELFDRIDVEPEQYLTKALTTYDQKAIQNPDGTLTCTIDGIRYELPKTFIDLPDEFDTSDYGSIFLDYSAEKDYVSAAGFYSDIPDEPGVYHADIKSGTELSTETAQVILEGFASRFYDDASLGTCEPTEVAGFKGYRCPVTGYLNQGFGTLANNQMSGFIVLFNNTNTGRTEYAMMIQNAARNEDHSDIFEEILKSARAE